MQLQSSANAIELDLMTDLQYLEMIEGISQSITKGMGFDEDRTYWIGMAIREGVINAMLHGNRMDAAKRVRVHFGLRADSLQVIIQDQGVGFDPALLPDPLDPANLLKPSGRGLFCIKSFMDDVSFHRMPGGMEIRMLKRLASN